MKIAIVGAGNAGCITALSYHLEGRIMEDKVDEIEIYHDPNIPIERVGQGTQSDITSLIFDVLDLNWYDNPIGATFKTGILYEGWGKKHDKIFHPFVGNNIAIHYVPHKLSKLVLESGHFNVIEKSISDPEKEIDADYIFDCRGRHNRDKSNYDTLINPLNSVLLAHKEGRDPNLTYTRTVATPNGWTFIIPNVNSVSYGYLYNDTITSTQVAREDFMDRFRIYQDSLPLSFENYMAKNIFVGERTILNGNACGFVEPMEATASTFFYDIAKNAWDGMFGIKPVNVCNNNIRLMMKEIETFILWHYQFGSKYDTPFWEYAKSLPFNPDEKFKEIVKDCIDYNEMTKHVLRGTMFNFKPRYGQWPSPSIKNWRDGVDT